MLSFENYEIWFITGSQHLYGQDTLQQVEGNSNTIVGALNDKGGMKVPVKFKALVTTSAQIREVCQEANNDARCIGVVCWMHTFSPAKMWIAGLSRLSKPLLHLHTQFNREIPWDKIDMDFMNLNQAAHGDREFGFIGARQRLSRKVVVGHWEDADVCEELDVWARAALAWADAQKGKVARFGDNMRDVAVTEGDKVAAQMQFGYEVHGYGVGDLVERIALVSEEGIDELVTQYMDEYLVAPELRQTKSYTVLREAARIELGLRMFLEEGGFTAFTTTFEDLHGVSQLPGLACQRLMADGYGFGAEGDWKTAALVRSMKVMADGLSGGTSFMEDYTYHMPRNGVAQVLGAHMLEVCPSIAEGKASLEIHPLSIGGKADPARLVFACKTGPALNATVVDMGNRFRMVVNTVDVVKAQSDLPNLPVAHALWTPHPDLKVAAAAWIHAGGAHHSGFSQAATVAHMRDFAEIAGIELLEIDEKTDVLEFRKEIRTNAVFYALGKDM